ncbi:MAG: D-2-hydroxyacid dehydrogenase [Eubacterium sp.]|nr:D-2-hydroxyacid dehydrogenase [Eubacterium sp.]
MTKKKAVNLEASAVNPGDLSWDPVTAVCLVRSYDNTVEEEKWDRIQDAEIVLTNKVIIDEAVFERFPQIRYVGVCATGYNVVDLKAARERGITVTNVPAYSTDSVAQHTFALLLDLCSKVTLHDESVRAGDWSRVQTFCYWKAPVIEIAGKTIGIYGYGNIGRTVARIAKSFGMQVLVYTAHPEKYLDHADGQLTFTDEETLFRQSDFITFHCPLTPETDRLVRKENIARMRDGVILINVARGGLVCEADLAEALRSGKVGGAGLDVVAEEPMPADSPLAGVPNLIITPHIAWASSEARTRLINIVAENIRGWLEGKPQNVVN